MAYIDYTYYTGTYHGSEISAIDFEYFEAQAEAVIKEMTLNASDEAKESDTVKMATCAAMEKLFEVLGSSSAGSAMVSSERVGEYSVSYRNVSASEKYEDAVRAAKAAARVWLGPAGLMYRGV